MTEEERREAARDLGRGPGAGGPGSCSPRPHWPASPRAQAVPLLEAAVRDRPDDLRARESLGYALGMLDRLEEARHAYEEVLRIEPRPRVGPPLPRSHASPDSGGPTWRPQALREVIAVNPWRSDYRLALARNCAQAGDWPGAVAACREAIRLNPELFEARSLLVQGYLRLRRAGEGRRRVPDPARLLPRRPRGLAAMVRAAEASGTGRSGPGLEWPASRPDSTRGSGRLMRRSERQGPAGRGLTGPCRFPRS